ncbi:MAG: DUF167 family protein [archaeon]
MKVTVIAKPNSKLQKAELAGDHKIKVWAKSKPINGKANTEIIQFLKKIIKKQTGTLPKIDIIQGGTASAKIVEMDCTWSQVTAALEAANQNS